MKLHFYSACIVLLAMLPQLAVSAQGQKATVVRTAIENRIADIHVLKDTSATAIYDLHSANGVIVITPPSGQNGHTNINYRNQFGFSFIVDYIDMMNSGQNLQHQMQCVMSDPNSNFFLVSPDPAYPDWIKIREA